MLARLDKKKVTPLGKPKTNPMQDDPGFMTMEEREARAAAEMENRVAIGEAKKSQGEAQTESQGDGPEVLDQEDSNAQNIGMFKGKLIKNKKKIEKVKPKKKTKRKKKKKKPENKKIASRSQIWPG